MLVRLMLCFLLIYEVLSLYDYLRVCNTIEKKQKMFNAQLLKMVGFILCLMAILVYSVILFCVIVLVTGVSYVISKHQKKSVQIKVIEYYGYKIFKFLINQISSGILVSDAVQAMYLIVQESELRKILIDVSAYYAQTTNIKGALNLIKSSYKGLEVDTLCIAIEQGIQTGSNEETLLRMEELLFKKYIFQIKRETELRKKRGVLSIFFLCAVVVLMIAIPMVVDIGTAFNQIFYY